jgi:hypothetical protein
LFEVEFVGFADVVDDVEGFFKGSPITNFPLFELLEFFGALLLAGLLL